MAAAVALPRRTKAPTPMTRTASFYFAGTWLIVLGFVSWATAERQWWLVVPIAILLLVTAFTWVGNILADKLDDLAAGDADGRYTGRR